MITKNKTKPTKSSGKEMIDGIENIERKDEAVKLLNLFKSITGENPIVWGKGLIGFGKYHYKYASGREGDWFKTGFAIRKTNISIYVLPGLYGLESELEKLGEFTKGVSCIYIKKLADIDTEILKAIISKSIARL